MAKQQEPAALEGASKEIPMGAPCEKQELIFSRGRYYRDWLDEYEAADKKIKIRKSSYKYKDKKHAKTTFAFDVRTFQARHGITRKDFAAIIDYPYWSVCNWFTDKHLIPDDINGICDTMRKIDSLTGKHP